MQNYQTSLDASEQMSNITVKKITIMRTVFSYYANSLRL